MKYRKLGRTDLDVSVVCQGCWSIIHKDPTWGGNDLNESISAIHTSLDAGVNFFDTAEMYGSGESEEILAKAFAGRRQEVVIADKVLTADLEPEKLKQACERSLRRLKSDYIDLYQIHWPSREVPVADSLAAMEQLKAEGKIRAIGVSNFGVSFLEEAVAAGGVETNQLCYNLLWRPIEHSVQPLCVENDIGVLCYSPICQGLLAGKFSSADEVPPGRARTRLFSRDHPQAVHDEHGCEAEAFQAIDEIRDICRSVGEPMGNVAMAWLLARPGVTSVVVGGRSAAQAAENAGAGDLELPVDVVEALSAATEKVKERAGTNCDFWQSATRMER